MIPPWPPASASWAQFRSVAPSLGVEVSPVGVRDAVEIERAIATFGQGPNGGLIVFGAALAIIHRELIVRLAALHKLPAVYPLRAFVTGRRSHLLRA